MKTAFAVALALASVCSYIPAAHADSDNEKIAKKTATQVGRVAVGSAIGGKVGGYVAGGAAGTFVGAMLTPSSTGCFKGETCAKGYPVYDGKTGERVK